MELFPFPPKWRSSLYCRLYQGDTCSVAFHPEGHAVISGGFDSMVSMHYVGHGHETAVRAFRGHTAAVTHVDFNRYC